MNNSKSKKKKEGIHNRYEIISEIFQSYSKSTLFRSIYLIIIGVSLSLVLEVPLILSLLVPFCIIILWRQSIYDDIMLMLLYSQESFGWKQWYYRVNNNLFFGAMVLKNQHTTKIYDKLKFDAIVILRNTSNSNVNINSKQSYFLGNSISITEWKEKKVTTFIVNSNSDGVIDYPTLLEAAKFIDIQVSNNKKVYCQDVCSFNNVVLIIMAYLIRYEFHGVHEAYVHIKLSMHNISPFSVTSTSFKRIQEFEKYKQQQLH